MIFKYPKESFVISIVLVLAVIFIVNYNKKEVLVQYEIDKCRWSFEMESLEIAGIVSEKMRDERNHNNPTIMLSNSEKVEKVILTNELGDFFEFVMVGDSLKKEAGTLNILVIRDNEILKKELNYGCQNQK